MAIVSAGRSDFPMSSSIIYRTALGVIALYLVGALIRWTLSSKKHAADGPREIDYTIPYIGHALSLAGDKKSFFMRTLEKCKQQPFSLLVAGSRHFVFSDISDISAIHRNTDNISIRNIKTFLYTNMFGFNKPDALKMWDVNKEAYHIDHRWLLGREEQNQLTAKYFRKIEEHMESLNQKLSNSKAGEVVVDGLLTVVNFEGSATIDTFYGETTLRRNPQILQDMIYFVTRGIKPTLLKIPKFLAPGAYASRSRIITSFAELADELDTRDDVSGYLEERYRYINSRAFPREAVGADMFRHLFATLLNSLPTTYQAMLHILSSKSLLQDVRRELEDIGYDDLEPDQRVDILPEKAPLLRSVWFETLRKHNNLLTLRSVDHDTTISTRPDWKLVKGTVISIPAVLVHYNQGLHPSPNTFRANRFLDKSLGGHGENPSRTLKPFGGGSSYCPGRIFGEKQLMGFIAALVMRFDVEAVDANFEIPPVSDFDDLWKRPRVLWRIKARRIGSD